MEEDKYFSGQALYGDDFTEEQIKQWFEEEKEAYASLGASVRERYVYEYHQLNWQHGYRHLPMRNFSHVLGFGSAYGDELVPIIQRVDKITIVEPSDDLRVDAIQGKPVTYVKPTLRGNLPFPDAQFDLITIFGCLHHIPNVSFVVSELVRCLQPGGYLLIREPAVSMGDWRKPRPGLTRHERGIAPNLMAALLKKLPVRVVHRTRCIFPLTLRLRFLTRKPVFNSRLALLFDRFFSMLFSFQQVYHPHNVFQKLQPTNLFYVLVRT